MCNVFLCAVALLFSAALINGAERDNNPKYSWSHLSQDEEDRNLVSDQEQWDPEALAAVQEKLPRGVVTDGRFRRAAQMPQMPEPPSGMPEPPAGMSQPPEGMPKMPQAPGMPS